VLLLVNIYFYFEGFHGYSL